MCKYDMSDRQVGEKLKKIRREKHISQSEASQALGISQGYLSEVESGKRHIRVEFVEKASEFYDVSPQEILGLSFACENVSVDADEFLRSMLEGTGVEDSLDIYLDFCRYMMIRTVYSLNPHNSDNIFSIPGKLAVRLSLAEIEKCCENIRDYLVKDIGKCKNIEPDEKYTAYLKALINRCENMLK